MEYFVRIIDADLIEIRTAERSAEEISEGKMYLKPGDFFYDLSFDQVYSAGQGVFALTPEEDSARSAEDTCVPQPPPVPKRTA